MFVSITADGTSVSTFLCTQSLGPEEISLSAKKLSGIELSELNSNFNYTNNY